MADSNNLFTKYINDLLYTEEDEQNDDKWCEIPQTPKVNLKGLLMDKIRNGEHTDVVIRIDEENFDCHTILLRYHSIFFSDLKLCPVVKLPSSEVNPAAFQLIYDWMKQPKEIVTRDNILYLFNASTYLQINELCDQCWTYIDNRNNFSEETAFGLYLDSLKAEQLVIKNLMVNRVFKYFLTLVSTKEFLKLNLNEIKKFFTLNEIGVNNESEVFLSAIHWLNYDWENREQYVVELMECIRFGNMETCFLIQLQKQFVTVNEVLRIIRNPSVNKFIIKGTTYKNMRVLFSKRDNYKDLLKKEGLVELCQRQWIYDPQCEYHHRFDCPSKYCTYSMFQNYLAKLRTKENGYWKCLKEVGDSDNLPLCCNMGRKPGEEGVPRILHDPMLVDADAEANTLDDNMELIDDDFYIFED